MKETFYRSAGGVVCSESMVLLLERPSRHELRLPKGHIEEGEAPLDAALREVREETGYVQLTVVADLGTRQVEFVDPYRKRRVRREERYYLMFLEDRERAVRSAHEKQFVPLWVPADEAIARLTFPAEQETVKRALRWLEVAAKNKEATK